MAGEAGWETGEALAFAAGGAVSGSAVGDVATALESAAGCSTRAQVCSTSLIGCRARTVSHGFTAALAVFGTHSLNLTLAPQSEHLTSGIAGEAGGVLSSSAVGRAERLF